MQKNFYWSWEVPENTQGLVVVSDVWAATTNLCIMLAKEPASIIIVNRKTVGDLKEKNPDSLVVGENNHIEQEIFDVSNFPSQVEVADLRGRDILYMSSNGSRVIESAYMKGAEKVITVSFTNISAVVDFLRTYKGQVTLVASGSDGNEVVEDKSCVDALSDILNDKKVDLNGIVKNSLEFIADFYKGDATEEDLKITGTIDSSKIIPECEVDNFGTISVSVKR